MDSVSDSELPAIYRQATIFVMPARAEYHAGSVEGFGIVYLEASASGLPVVAARTGGAAEAVRENETGLLVPPDDPPALALALARLLDDGALRQRMGRAGRRWVEREMNWDRAAQQFLSIISTAAAGKIKRPVNCGKFPHRPQTLKDCDGPTHTLRRSCGCPGAAQNEACSCS